jgi:hypothetical protein
MKEEQPHSANNHQRFRREDPVRTSPIRNWSTLYRRPNGGPAPVEDLSTKPPLLERLEQERLQSDTVSHGVTLGYQVIEEYLRQGQRIAQQVNNRSYNPETMGNDLRDMVERLARYYTDLGALWGDLVNSIVANPDFMNSLLRPFQAPPPPPVSTNGATANGTMTITLEVISARPTQVMLDLHPHAEKLPLTTHGLRAVDPEKLPLTDITFAPSTDHGPVCLRIRIPEVQPPDVYSGLIVEKATNLPKGSLTVRVLTWQHVPESTP